MCNWSREDSLIKPINKSYIRKTLNLSKFDLKVGTLEKVTTSWGKEFQSFIICCEKVNHLVEVLLYFL